MPQLAEDRTGGCLDELVADGQLQHWAIAPGDRDEPWLGVNEYVKADAGHREHLVGRGFERGVGAAPDHHPSTEVIVERDHGVLLR